MFRAYLTFVLIKGLTMGVVATLINVDFERALILVLVSAIVTGAFGVIVALVQSRENSKVHERLEKLELTGRQIERTSQDIKNEVTPDPNQLHNRRKGD